MSDAAELPATVLAAIKAGEWVLVADRADDVAALGVAGRPAMCSPNGHARLLQGAKVAVIAETRERGCGHAESVARGLHGIAAKVLIYRPAAPHQTVAEHLRAGLSLADLVAVERPKPADGHVPLRAMSMAELMATPDANEHDFLLGPLIVKGSRIVVGAHSGVGKTTFGVALLAAILRAEDFLSWHGSGNGTRALVLDVEQGRRTVKRRFIEAGLHELPEKVQLVHQPDGLSLDSDERQRAELEAIFEAFHPEAVLADPLYKMHRGDPNDERRAVDLMRQFDAWRERYGFALIMPAHCRKPLVGTKFSIHDISGSGAFTFGAEIIVGLQRVSKGYSFLHWWKDREGDLGCINERWGLLFDRERGFRRDPKDLDRTPVRDQVRAALAQSPGMTIDELREATDAKQTTIRRALADIGAMDDGARTVAERHWSLPASLFDGAVT